MEIDTVERLVSSFAVPELPLASPPCVQPPIEGPALLTWPLAPLACRSREERANHRGAWLQYLALRRGLWEGEFVVAVREG
ncbi:MAG: hypothetical protein Q8O40_13315 [Chloroflexota bacterium]|nr:hypothetical protein [Chloroflexota bacterium]